MRVNNTSPFPTDVLHGQLIWLKSIYFRLKMYWKNRVELSIAAKRFQSIGDWDATLVVSMQCQQMANQFFQYLAIYNNELLNKST